MKKTAMKKTAKKKTAMKKTAMKKTAKKKAEQWEKFQPGYLGDNIYVGEKGKVWRRYGCNWWQQ